MTDVFLGLASTCIVQILEVDLVEDPSGWTESLHIEVAGGPTEGPDARFGSPCPTITLPQPAGAIWTRTQGRTRRTDGTGDRLRDVRFELTPPQVDRSRTTVIHVPELSTGDRVILDLERQLPPGAVRYRATARYFRLASSAPIDADEGLKVGDGRVWGREVADAVATVGEASRTDTAAFARASEATRIEGRLRLVVPPRRDPLVTLFPGGGSSLETQLFVTLPPHDVPVAWIVPAPPGADVRWKVQAPARAELTTEDGVARIESPPSEGPTRVTVQWTTPDAPTYGSVPPALGPGSPGVVADWVVSCDRGVVTWEEGGHRWVLEGIDGTGVLPDRDRMIRALNQRFVRQGVPEPSIPGELRGLPPSIELAAALPDVLRAQVGIGDWPHDPLWPRKLRKARRSGAVTATEAGLILWLMARQIGFDARWGLVRPHDGPPEASDPLARSPADFVRPVVAFRLEDTWQYVDPTCAACGPFELPSELWGAELIGPGLPDRTPPAPAGTVEARSTDGAWTYRFTGQRALELRRSVTRGIELAAAMGATPEAMTGFLTRGEPIEVVVEEAARPFDPFQLGEPQAGKIRVGRGTRLREQPSDNAIEVAPTRHGALEYARRVDGERVIEGIRSAQDWVDATDVQAIEALRSDP